MFGWIHESIRQLIHRKYGAESWSKIVSMAGYREGEENIIDKAYRDDETFRLVNSASTIIGIPVEEIWEAYGGFLIRFTMETGWDELLRTLSKDLQGFLDNLDSLHYFIDHVVYDNKLRGPSFRCQLNDDGSIILHYYSKRQGLYPIVKGVVREVARQIYKLEIAMRVVERKLEVMSSSKGEQLGDEHVVFEISSLTAPFRKPDTISESTVVEVANRKPHDLQVGIEDFRKAFPYHICFDQALTIHHCGQYVASYLNAAKETQLDEILTIEHPQIQMAFNNFVSFINGTFVFTLSSPNEGIISVPLKGQMLLIHRGEKMVYLASPYVTTIKELLRKGIFLGDIPLHDATRDMILLNQSRLNQVELNEQLKDTKKQLLTVEAKLKTQEEQYEGLIKKLIPEPLAESFLAGQQMNGDVYKNVSLLACDVTGFNTICSGSSPMEVIALIEAMISQFDRLINLNGCVKVDVIGDCYLVAAGLPAPEKDHVERVSCVAFGMQWESRSIPRPNSGFGVTIRVGIHSGTVTAGVVAAGTPKFAVFGESLGVVSTLNRLCPPRKTHCSSAVYQTGQVHGLVFEKSPITFGLNESKKLNGSNDVTYFLTKHSRRSLWEIIRRTRPESSTIDGFSELNEPDDSAQSIASLQPGAVPTSARPPAEPANGTRAVNHSAAEQDSAQRTKVCTLL